MKPIPDAHKKVPMMFRAQIAGRSQLQYLDPSRKKARESQDIELWTDEWVDKAELISAQETEDIQTDTYGAKSYQISWRFVTNGGQDDGILRPVLGASGIPFYPGSSMKGAFRHACQQAEKAEKIPQGTCHTYCGDESEITPGSLRFLGAYPTNDWTKGLLDLVHPQQGWQVKTRETHSKPKGESAYAQISLYQPTLRCAISSKQALSSEHWHQIWQIWEWAVAAGLGSKVSNGYGQAVDTAQSFIYRASLTGQGQASKLIDGTGEFRHNIFRAALRGHALRIFGGLIDKTTAEKLVEELFGGIQSRNPTVGLLSFQFRESQLSIDDFGQGNYSQPTYDVEGTLHCSLTRSLSNLEQEKALTNLVARLMQFAMILGGFGKSWRRIDHRIFFDDYYENPRKALIGCHWEWLSENTQRRNLQVGQVEKVGAFIDKVRQAAKDWIQAKGVNLGNVWTTEWREAWHPSNVQVWGRLAEDSDNSVAVKWFHQPYQFRTKNLKEGSIRESSLAGKIGKISRIWHRMYPLVLLKRDSDNPKKPIVQQTPRYLEIITIFPDDSREAEEFISFLRTNPEGFQQIWGDQ